MVDNSIRSCSGFASKVECSHCLGLPSCFGMVAIEAAAHGTPTIAFDEGGVSDAIAEGVNGRLLRSGDYAAMVSALAGLKVSPTSTTACREHAKGFGWDCYEEGLLEIMQRITADET